MPGRHKANTKNFGEETYAEQAKTITIGIVYLGRAIKANIKRAKLEGKKSPKEKRIKNLEALIERIKKYNP